jgi:hypothetical protein
MINNFKKVLTKSKAFVKTVHGGLPNINPETTVFGRPIINEKN